MNIESSCHFCHDSIETPEHLFFDCMWTKRIWFALHLNIENVPSHVKDNPIRHWINHFINTTNSKDFYLYGYAWLFTLHTIWKIRNSIVFEHQNPNIDTIVNDIWIATNNWCVARDEYLDDEEQMVDIPNADSAELVLGEYIVVVDGSFDIITGMAGTGAIIYDGEEIKATGYTKFKGHDPLEAEAMAVKVGLELAKKCGLLSVTICGDNQALMEDLEAQNSEACWSCYSHYEDIFSLLRDFNFVNFIWNSRSKVQEAHRLANWARLGLDIFSIPVNSERAFFIP
ncbi:hypothetical protein ACHQM5_014259 [Ranunculus cassubicifolius]